MNLKEKDMKDFKKDKKVKNKEIIEEEKNVKNNWVQNEVWGDSTRDERNSTAYDERIYIIQVSFRANNMLVFVLCNPVGSRRKVILRKAFLVHSTSRTF